MSRLLIALALLLGVITTLAVPAAAEPANPNPIDQAGWVARKQHLLLPNGVRLAYVELGNPRGSAVLLLHGFTDSSRVWTILAPHLAGHRLIVPDQRGHGASDAPRCCYGTAVMADDALLLLDALKIDRAAVVGHSMGSMVAQLLAAEHPDRVTRIALIGSTALSPVKRGDWLWDQVARLRLPIASNTEFLRLWSLSASPTPVDPELIRFADPETAVVALHVWKSVMRDLVDIPVARHAGDVRAPVLILSGGRDELFPAEHHIALAKAYPGAEAHVFADLGHNLIVERPDEVGPKLAAFLQD